jgi:hypothetical protein
MSPMHQARAAGDVYVLEHSLVAAKMSVLRDNTTATVQFRRALESKAAAGDRGYNYALSLEEHSASLVGKEQSPLLIELFRKRDLIDNQISALFNVMDSHAQIFA